MTLCNDSSGSSCDSAGSNYVGVSADDVSGLATRHIRECFSRLFARKVYSSFLHIHDMAVKQVKKKKTGIVKKKKTVLSKKTRGSSAVKKLNAIITRKVQKA